MTYDTNQLTRASAINMSIRRLLMEVATFWQIGEKRVCTGGHESDGYPWQCIEICGLFTFINCVIMEDIDGDSGAEGYIYEPEREDFPNIKNDPTDDDSSSDN